MYVCALSMYVRAMSQTIMGGSYGENAFSTISLFCFFISAKLQSAQQRNLENATPDKVQDLQDRYECFCNDSTNNGDKIQAFCNNM